MTAFRQHGRQHWCDSTGERTHWAVAVGPVLTIVAPMMSSTPAVFVNPTKNERAITGGWIVTLAKWTFPDEKCIPRKY